MVGDQLESASEQIEPLLFEGCEPLLSLRQLLLGGSELRLLLSVLTTLLLVVLQNLDVWSLLLHLLLGSACFFFDLCPLLVQDRQLCLVERVADRSVLQVVPVIFVTKIVVSLGCRPDGDGARRLIQVGSSGLRRFVVFLAFVSSSLLHRLVFDCLLASIAFGLTGGF